MDAMAAVASETFTSTSAPIQYAAVRAFRGGPEIEKYLQVARRMLQTLGNWMVDRLEAAGVTTHRPAGAFYLFPDFGPHRKKLRDRGAVSSPRLCEQLLEDTGVAVLPGADFGRSKDELTARLAYVDFDGAKVMRALMADDSAKIDDEFLFTHCPNVVTATRRICDWVQS
jgi:aspartate aminotransferase